MLAATRRVWRRRILKWFSLSKKPILKNCTVPGGQNPHRRYRYGTGYSGLCLEILRIHSSALRSGLKHCGIS